jgi:hypothetical protein
MDRVPGTALFRVNSGTPQQHQVYVQYCASTQAIDKKKRVMTLEEGKLQ